MTTVGISVEILVGISCRIIGLSKIDDSMPPEPDFKAVNYCTMGEALWVPVMLVWHAPWYGVVGHQSGHCHHDFLMGAYGC